MKLKSLIIPLQVLIVLLCTFGLFRFSYMHYIPGTDYKNEYAEMYKTPLDFSVADAPFIYRQFNAVITHALYKMGIRYPTEIAFVGTGQEQDIYFCAMLSNYLAVLFMSFFIIITVNHLLNHSDFTMPVLSSLLCFFSFFMPNSVLTGMADGWSWFLVSVAFYYYIKMNLWMLSAIFLLSIFQRETMPLIFCVFSVFDFITNRDQSKTTFYLGVFISGLISMLLYLLLRAVIFPVSGNEHQLDLYRMINALLGSFQMSKGLFIQAIVGQNILFIFLISVICKGYNRPSQSFFYNIKDTYLFHFISAIFVLYLLGWISAIGNNIGRLSAMITPVISIMTIVNFASISKNQIEITGIATNSK